MLIMFDWSFPSWPHEWQEHDVRVPALKVQLGEQTYGLYLASLPFWLEIVSAVLLQACFAGLIGKAVYRTIITQPRGSSLAFWTGFGIYIPLLIFLPYAFVEYFGFHNKLFRFTLCIVIPIVCAFRTTEAIYGFAPKRVTGSERKFIYYFASPLFLRHDSKTQRYIKASRKCILGYFLRFCGFLWLTGGVQSLFYAGISSFPPIVSGPRPDDWYTWNAMVDLNRWKDSLLVAVLFQLYLSTFGEGLVFVTALMTGRQVERLMDNPMFESASPSDFWGRRWNLLIHQCLKNGVYKPIRSKGGSPSVATFAAFVASALFHEWLLKACFGDYDNRYGMTTLFFTWQAALVTIDGLIGNSKLCQTFSKLVPVGPLRTAFVIMCGLPVAHLFVDSCK